MCVCVCVGRAVREHHLCALARPQSCQQRVKKFPTTTADARTPLPSLIKALDGQGGCPIRHRIGVSVYIVCSKYSTDTIHTSNVTTEVNRRDAPRGPRRGSPR